MSTNAIAPSSYRVRLLTCCEVAERTKALYFERPTGFSFKPDQFIDLMLLDPPETDSAGNTRAFTIDNGPSDDHPMVVTRFRDTVFTGVLES